MLIQILCQKGQGTKTRKGWQDQQLLGFEQNLVQLHAGKLTQFFQQFLMILYHILKLPCCLSIFLLIPVQHCKQLNKKLLPSIQYGRHILCLHQQLPFILS